MDAKEITEIVEKIFDNKLGGDKKHTEIMVAIGNIDTTIKKVITPAVDQVWETKNDITKLKVKQSLVTWVGSAVGLGFIYTIIRTHIFK